MKNLKVSIVLPARNEEQLIKASLLDISKFLNKKDYTYEIIVVLNGCTDNTEKIIIDNFSQNKDIKIVKSSPGYGVALKKGMTVAKGDYVGIFNVDFYDLRIIDLTGIDLYKADLIIGSKMTNWSVDKRPINRRIVSMLYNILLKVLFGFKGSDTHGIKIMRKSVVDAILKKCKTTSGIFDTEFVIKTQRAGFIIAELPVTIEEKRVPRFVNRFLSTPTDIYNLYNALN